MSIIPKNYYNFSFYINYNPTILFWEIRLKIFILAGAVYKYKYNKKIRKINLLNYFYLILTNKTKEKSKYKNILDNK